MKTKQNETKTTEQNTKIKIQTKINRSEDEPNFYNEEITMEPTKPKKGVNTLNLKRLNNTNPNGTSKGKTGANSDTHA